MLLVVISIVIVTYNSSRHLVRCLEDIAKQHYPVDEVIVVDNNSADVEKLRAVVMAANMPVRLLESDVNLGYALGANRGTAGIRIDSQFILYVGPDTFLAPNYVGNGIEYLMRTENLGVAAVSGKLLGYDFETGKPTGLIDSTGVDEAWYGRWFDRWQGCHDGPKCDELSADVPALCGTALLCRVECLRSIEKGPPYSVYDSSFFMYKEDIELSLRLRAAGYSLRYNPGMIAYHCRGWDRKKMSRRAKILSARNEAQLNANRGMVKFAYSILKLYFVSRFDGSLRSRNG